MYTYGYIRESVMAHCDLDEEELQAMNVLKRLYIFANEAMQAICSVKPKYKYFECKIVSKYNPVIREIDNYTVSYREATEQEIYDIEHGNPNNLPIADKIATKDFYESQHIYLIKTHIQMPDDFIAFTNKQSFIKDDRFSFNKEKFIDGDWFDNSEDVFRPVIYSKELVFSKANTIVCNVEGEYMVPYKAVWQLFISAMSDTEELDMPIDVLVCIPLYIASIVLQIDYPQKAQIKRSEYETALSRVTATDNMPVNKITPSF